MRHIDADYLIKLLADAKDEELARAGYIDAFIDLINEMPTASEGQGHCGGCGKEEGCSGNCGNRCKEEAQDG